MKAAARRRLLKSLAVTGGALIVGRHAPKDWVKPVVETVALPAHAQTSVCPVLEAAPRSAGFVLSMSTVLRDLGQIRVQTTFRNIHATNNMQFAGNFQLTTTPGGTAPPTLPVTVNSAPAGIVPPGSTFTYDLTIDLSGLPATDTNILFRPVDENLFGTIGPLHAEIVSSTSTCG